MGYRNDRFFVQHPGETVLVIFVRFLVSGVCIEIFSTKKIHAK